METDMEATAECKAPVDHVVRRHQPWGQMPVVPFFKDAQRMMSLERERKRAFGVTASTLENAGLRKSRQMRILKE